MQQNKDSSSEASTFIDDLLLEQKEQEMANRMTYFDLQLVKYSEICDKIEEIENTAAEEIEIISGWADGRKEKLLKEASFIEHQCKEFLSELDLKTLHLAHGILKFRKTPDKVEVEDLEQFLKAANKDMIDVIPEQIKPNLTKIKRVIQMSRKTPPGIKYIEGTDKFTIKLINREAGNDTKKET